jgi:hypothetical protein
MGDRFRDAMDDENPQIPSAKQTYGIKVPRRGGFPRRDTGIEKVPINEIVPDPAQPRNTLPSAVRMQFTGNPDEIQNIFAYWLDLVAQETGRSSDDVSYHFIRMTKNGESDRTEESGLHNYKPGPLEHRLNRLVMIAASIKQKGLLNPISVARENNIYRIEAGERRWLAYHWLNIVDEDGDWTSIPATLVQQVDVWKQAFENNARDDINAISRARQLAILLMAMYSEARFTSFHNCSTELDYYAQISDGTKWRVKRGRGEELLRALGLSNTAQISQYRSLLSLPEPVWIIADDLDWTENKLRGLVGLSNEEALRRAAVEAQKEGYTFTTVKVSADFFKNPPVQKQNPALGRLESGLTKLSGITKKHIKTMDNDERIALSEKLATMRRQIEEIEGWM